MSVTARPGAGSSESGGKGQGGSTWVAAGRIWLQQVTSSMSAGAAKEGEEGGQGMAFSQADIQSPQPISQRSHRKLKETPQDGSRPFL